LPQPLLDAWQGALAAEHQAAFGYGLLGARLHGNSRLSLAVACSNAHEALREQTEQAIAAAGLAPVPPAADYAGLYPVLSPAQAAALAVRLEQDCAWAWRYLYAEVAAVPADAAVPAGLRAAAQAALTASAVRAVQWRGTPQPFPGLPS
jgi:hypothetical protein